MNTAIRDLAVSLGGEQAWEEIRLDAGLPVRSFVLLEQYDDAVTESLVAATARHFGQSTSDVLEAFGEHWVLHTAAQAHGPLFGALGRSLPDALAALDALHARVALSMPALRPPSFVVEEVEPGRLLLHYCSERTGFAPMVVGLVRGLGRAFDTTVAVAQVACASAEGGVDVFEVRHGRAGTATVAAAAPAPRSAPVPAAALPA